MSLNTIAQVCKETKSALKLFALDDFHWAVTVSSSAMAAPGTAFSTYLLAVIDSVAVTACNCHYEPRAAKY